jgi:hypothetical protein
MTMWRTEPSAPQYLYLGQVIAFCGKKQDLARENPGGHQPT